MKILSIVVSIMCASASSAFAPSASMVKSKQQIVPSSVDTSAVTVLNMASETGNPFDFVSGIFSKNDEPKQQKKEKLPDVVIDPDYNIALAFGAVGILIELLFQGSVWGAVQGGVTLLFASFLAVQASRIRFVFDETSFELKVGEDSSGENFVVGGENRWKYDSLVNYDFFPSRGLPILVYFKETQTPEESWKKGPGGLDKVGGGQLHFFPAVANVDQLKEQFALRGCAKVED
mmetsp:Transcript_13782/g.15500  ORF Transcript_13782/g.15500 Transcript_13782/m.15500 type:complete len:233 (+) Transcript_13782:123-821(+)